MLIIQPIFFPRIKMEVSSFNCHTQINYNVALILIAILGTHFFKSLEQSSDDSSLDIKYLSTNLRLTISLFGTLIYCLILVLLDISVSERGVSKYPAINVLIYTFLNYIRCCFIYFGPVLLGTYMFIIVITSCTILFLLGYTHSDFWVFWFEQIINLWCYLLNSMEMKGLVDD